MISHLLQVGNIMHDVYEISSILEHIREALQKNEQPLAFEKVHELQDKQNNTPLNIAITGQCDW